MFRPLTLILTMALLLGWSRLLYGLDPSMSFYQYQFTPPPPEINFPGKAYDVEGDGQGGLWVATNSGLIRYDGLEANHHRVSEHPQLLSNRPRELFADSEGRLFIGSERGVSLYHDKRFELVLEFDRASNRAPSFTEDATGAVWIGSAHGLWRFADGVLSQPSRTRWIVDVSSLFSQGERLYVGVQGQLHVVEADVVVSVDLPAGFSRAIVNSFGLPPAQGC